MAGTARSSTAAQAAVGQAAVGQAAASQADPSPTALAVVGLHGHGRTHVREVVRLARTGRVRVAAVVDPTPVGPADLAWFADDAPSSGVPAAEVAAALDGATWHPDLTALLDAGPPDVVVLATPIHTHHDLTAQALRAGCDVLLEKPPTASLDELEQLLRVEAEGPAKVQVGFQTFGSGTLPAVHALIADGEIGDVVAVSAVGTWVRTTAYWGRAAWAGRRTLGGRPVVDGVVTNPLAHAVATALHLAGARTVDDVATTELDQYRAHDIEADDTSVVRVRTTTGVPVTCALTLCADEHTAPLVTVTGTRGSAVLDYYADTVHVTGPRGSRTLTAARTDLLTDLLDHRVDRSRPLLSPLAGTGAFMRVLDAVRAAPDPRPIRPPHARVVHDGAGERRVVVGVEEWCARAAAAGATFAELGAPWTTGGPR